MLERLELINERKCALSRMLSKAQSDTNQGLADMALICEVPLNTFKGWIYGTSLPPPGKLGLLAKACKIPLNELEKAYRISEEMKKTLAENRTSLRNKTRKARKKIDEPNFPGHIDNLRIISQTNEQTPKYQFGRR